MIYSVCTTCKEVICRIYEWDGDLDDDDVEHIKFPCRECFEEMVRSGEGARFDLHRKCNKLGCWAFDPAWRHRKPGCHVIICGG